MQQISDSEADQGFRPDPKTRPGYPTDFWRLKNNVPGPVLGRGPATGYPVLQGETGPVEEKTGPMQ